MWARLSILGLYNYDSTIFDPIEMPGDLDKDTFIALLIGECAELPVLYPNPDIFRQMLSAWVRQHRWNWDELYKTMMYDYNPIHNYDRHEETDDTTHTTVDNKQVGNIHTQATTTGENAAYPSNNLVRSDRQSGDSVNDSTNRVQGDDNTDYTHRSYMYGNIGVTTTQQMIDQQRDSVRYNLYTEMLTDFVDAFCVRVY